MGAKVTIVLPNHLTSTPRAVRNGLALTRGGFDVTLAYGQVMPRLREDDRLLARTLPFRTVAVDLTNRSVARAVASVRRRVAARIAAEAPLPLVLEHSLALAAAAVARAVHDVRADVVLAQQHAMLPVGAALAERQGARLVADIEDLLAESPHEPRAIVRAIERRYLRRCDVILTMSDVAGRRLHETNAGAVAPLTLYNAPALSERGDIAPPAARERPPRIYWFGQTIGPQSCAELLLRAVARAGQEVEVTFRGLAQAGYVERLATLARELGIAKRVQFLDRAPPTEMVRAAAEHDILFGSQPTGMPYNELAIGNKVFTGILAGLALLLTDTPAHREVIELAPDVGTTFLDGDVDSLAGAIDRLAEPAGLLRRRRAAWTLGSERLHWEHLGSALVDSVQAILGASQAKAARA